MTTEPLLTPEQVEAIGEIMRLLDTVAPTYLLLLPIGRQILSAEGQKPATTLTIVTSPGMTTADTATMLHLAAIKAASVASQKPMEN